MEQGLRVGETEIREVVRTASIKRRTTLSDVEGSFVCTPGDYPVVNRLFHSDFPGLVGAKTSAVSEFLIRVLDVVGSTLIVACALPIMMLTAALIKATSKGPIFYRQERVGKKGRMFTLYKFRTMIQDAEKHLGPVLAARDDERVTPVGRILRRMRLDELPQLFNILRGDMSLVGPRPERPFFVERHKALQGIRLSVKPGLTGLAQVRSFYDLKPAHKVKYDYLYIQKRSFLLNVYILLQTIPVVFSKKGW
jgi:lipopolysaccharide/colanic/teichoic acid biosynthesis glycosyltransferase